MNHFTLSLVILSASVLSPQSSDLIVESGAAFYVYSGSQIASDFITVNEGGNFYVDDPSCVAPATQIRGEGISVTPVELSSFTAELNGTEVKLNWSTATEVNNYGFDLERQVGNRQLALSSWVNVGFVAGHGNSNSTKQYSFIDKNPTGGKKFSYRLKQVDIDGEFEYSPVVEIDIFPDQFLLSQNYPNPFNPSTRIKYQLPSNSYVKIKVYDMLGNELLTLINQEVEAGIYEIEFEMNGFASGTYFYSLQAHIRGGSESFTSTKKMIILQ
jgi:hypothetical protein